MAYATEAKVEALMAKFAVDGSTTPTNTQLTIIIDDVAGDMDSRLAAKGVTVPVTSPAYFLDYLEGINSMGAAARTLRSMFPDVSGPGEQPAYNFWQARYNAFLKGVDDGSVIPPDAMKGETVAPSTYLTRNPDTEEDLGDISEPLFKMGSTF